MNEINYKDYMDNDKKVYIPVLEVRRTDGSILPKALRWIDGTIYHIDKILGNEPAATLKGGGIGVRYRVIIEGREKELWLEEDKWFVIKK